MTLGPRIRKLFLFLVLLFFAGTIGARFYSVLKPRHQPSTPAPNGERFHKEDPLVQGPFEDLIPLVADGDSVVGKRAGRIRYLGVDTPEKNEPFSRKALEFNKSLVQGKRVRVEPCPARPMDKYGRRLAYVFVGDMNVSKRILEEGLARVFDDARCNGKEREELWRTMIRAFDAKKGMWADSPADPIPAAEAAGHVGQTLKVTGKIRQVVKGNTYYYAHFSEDWKTNGLSLRFPIDEPDRLGRKPETLTGKTVTAIGLIEKRDFGPFITIHSPEQVLEEK